MNKLSTVVIITRNRAQDLSQCLESLARQTIIPYKVLVINNRSNDNTSDVIHSFETRLSIKEYYERCIGHAAARNRGLSEAKTEWISFIDDDCIASEKWYENILELINLHKFNKSLTAIVGASINNFPHNIFACAFFYRNALWLEENLNDSDDIMNYAILDTKNITFNRTLLMTNVLYFNSLYDGGEDIELGLRIHKNQLLAIYARDILVSHKEPNNLRAYIEKCVKYFRLDICLHSHRIISDEQLQLNRKSISFSKKHAIIQDITRELNVIEFLMVIILIKCQTIFVTFYQLMHRFKKL